MCFRGSDLDFTRLQELAVSHVLQWYDETSDHTYCFFETSSARLLSDVRNAVTKLVDLVVPVKYHLESGQFASCRCKYLNLIKKHSNEAGFYEFSPLDFSFLCDTEVATTQTHTNTPNKNNDDDTWRSFLRDDMDIFV